MARKSFDRFGEVALTDRAAALAYYGFLSLFPALIVAVALLALFGSYPETYRSIMDTLRDAAPGEAANTIDSALKNVMQGRGAEGLLGFGLLFAFLTASGAIGAAIRALEAINETRESASFVRSFVRSNLTRVWLTLVLMALMLIAAVALLIAGPFFGSIAESAGLGDTGLELVQLLRYPVGFAALLLALLLLYALGPAGTRRRLIEHVPGALLATLLWVLASMAFSFYVDNFGSYDKTYGTLGRRDRAAGLDLRRRHGDAAGRARQPRADQGQVGADSGGGYLAAVSAPLLGFDPNSSWDRFLRGADEFFDRIGDIGWPAMVLALSFYLAHLLARTRAWQNVLRAAYPKSEVSYAKITASYLAGAGLNSFIPARVGDAVKIFLAKRSIRRSSYPAIVSSFFVQSVFDTTAGILVFLLRPHPGPAAGRARAARTCRHSRSRSGPRTRTC